MATKEIVGSHADGEYFHSADLKNFRQAAGGGGVVGHSLVVTVTEANRVITVPAFNAYVPDGAGGMVLVQHAGAGVNVTASDGTNPRMDLLTLDSSGNLGMVDGAATAETGLVAEAPTPTLDDDEILLAVVRSPAAQTNVLAVDVRARAIDVSETALKVQRFTSGTSNWLNPSIAGARPVLIKLWGGGGGGGGADAHGAGNNRFGGGGGGGGCYRELWTTTDRLAATVAVAIGAGGTAGAGGVSGAQGASGGIGGTSTFGTHLTAYGGGGGSLGNQSNQSSGGGGAGFEGAGGSGAGAVKGIGAGILREYATAAADTFPVDATNGNKFPGMGVSGQNGGGANSNVAIRTAELAGGGGGATGTTPGTPHLSSPGGASLFSGGGGGAGGGLNTDNTTVSAGSNGGAASGAAGGAGGSAAIGQPGTSLMSGSGGGGGGGRTGSAGFAGGAGGVRGGGGGGGGATSGATAGSGGVGGAGYCEVIVY